MILKSFVLSFVVVVTFSLDPLLSFGDSVFPQSSNLAQAGNFPCC